MKAMLIRGGSNEDLRQPLNLEEQLQITAGMTEDANRSLMNLLQVLHPHAPCCMMHGSASDLTGSPSERSKMCRSAWKMVLFRTGPNGSIRGLCGRIKTMQ